MKTKLLLGNTNYPSRFEISDYTNGECATLAELEASLIEAINTHNPKLHVEEIEYSLDSDIFTLAKSSSYLGIIVEDSVLTDDEQAAIKRKPFDWQFIHRGKDNNLIRRPVIYTLITQTKILGRNVLPAQLVFPVLIDLMERCIRSSSCEPGNHPIYMLNILNVDVSAESIRRRFASLSMMGIDVIDIYHKSYNHSLRPRNLEEYCRIYLSDVRVGDDYITGDYCIDTKARIVHVKADRWVVGDYLQMNGTAHAVKGSSDKFYWIDVIPLVLIGIHEGYRLDYSQYEQFIKTEQQMSGNDNFLKSDKFHRMIVLRDYFQKLNTLRNE